MSTMEGNTVLESKDFNESGYDVEEWMSNSGSHYSTISNATFNSIKKDRWYDGVHRDSCSLESLPARSIEQVLAAINHSYRHDSLPHVLNRSSSYSGDVVQRELLQWTRSNLMRKVPSICWLRGSAGIGKSVVARTFAQTCEGKELLGTFFFSRADPNRNNPRYLVLAIAHAITVGIPGLRKTIIQAVRRRPEILQASLEIQFQALVIEPLLKWRNRIRDTFTISRVRRVSSTLFIIDGLDECLSLNEQQRIISLVLLAAKKKLPIRFLLCSRSEPHIREIFKQEDVCQFTKFLSLDGMFSHNQHIGRTLREQFSKIRSSERCTRLDFPTPWPTQGDLETLVDRSSGQSIYPDTVVKFVDAEDSHPCHQLQIILGLPPHNSSERTPTMNPNSYLDALYQHILQSATDNYPRLIRVITCVVLLREVKLATPAIIEKLLGLCPGGVSRTLQKMHPILHIQGIHDQITVHDTSFIDFFNSRSRSGPFFVDVWSYRRDLACRWLRLLEDDPSMSDATNSCLSTRYPSDPFPIWSFWDAFCTSLSLPGEKVVGLLETNNLRRDFVSILKAKWRARTDPFYCAPSSLLSHGFSGLRGIAPWLKNIMASKADLGHLLSVQFSVECRYTDVDSQFATWFRRWLVVEFLDRHTVIDLHLFFLQLLDSAERQLESLFDMDAPVDLRVVDPDDENCTCVCENKPIVQCTRQPTIFHVSLNNSITASLMENLESIIASLMDHRTLHLLSKGLHTILPWCPPDPRLLCYCSLMAKSVFVDYGNTESKYSAQVLTEWLKTFPPQHDGFTRPYLDQLDNLMKSRANTCSSFIDHNTQPLFPQR